MSEYKYDAQDRVVVVEGVRDVAHIDGQATKEDIGILVASRDMFAALEAAVGAPETPSIWVEQAKMALKRARVRR